MAEDVQRGRVVVGVVSMRLRREQERQTFARARQAVVQHRHCCE